MNGNMMSAAVGTGPGKILVDRVPILAPGAVRSRGGAWTEDVAAFDAEILDEMLDRQLGTSPRFEPANDGLSNICSS